MENIDTPLQAYLRTHTLEEMKAELGIDYSFHDTLPLVKIKYSQIDSPKTHEVVRWSRGTILEKDTWKMVAQPFVRFFNLGENEPEMKAFNWNDFSANEKLDGSLSILYFYAGEWHFSTSGSFGQGIIDGTNLTWEQSMFKALLMDVKAKYTCSDNNYKKIFNDSIELAYDFDISITYIFEFCSPFTKIVRLYKNYEMYLLGAYQISDSGPYECHPTWTDNFAKEAGLTRAPKHNFTSLAEVEHYMLDLEGRDKSNEGIVIRDNNGIRFKVKSKTYLALSRLHENGNICRVESLITLALAKSEVDEITLYFPEITNSLDQISEVLDIEYKKLLSLWEVSKNIESQKDFALSIKDNTPYANMLFQLRKSMGNLGTEKDLNAIWRHEDSLKTFFKVFKNFQIKLD